MDKKKSESEFDLVAVGDGISQQIEKYWKVILGVLVLGIAGFSLVLGMRQVEAKGEKKAFESLYKVTEVYTTRKGEFTAAKAEEEAKKNGKKEDGKTAKKKDEPPKQQATGDLDKDYGDILQKLQAFVQSTPDKQATGEAVLIIGAIYAEHDQKEKAAEAVSQVADGWSGRGLLFQVLNMRAGDLWSMSGKCDRAITHWNKIANNKNFLREDALLKTGLCHQKLGNLEKAKNMYQQIIALSPVTAQPAAPNNPFAVGEGQAGQNAQKFLRFLQFQEKLKNEKQTQNNTPPENKES